MAAREAHPNIGKKRWRKGCANMRKGIILYELLQLHPLHVSVVRLETEALYILQFLTEHR